MNDIYDLDLYGRKWDITIYYQPHEKETGYSPEVHEELEVQKMITDGVEMIDLFVKMGIEEKINNDVLKALKAMNKF